MQVRQSNQTKQSLLTRIGLMASSSLIFVLAVVLIQIYPGEEAYDWKAHVRVEESIKMFAKGSIDEKISELNYLKKELRMEKFPEDSELFRQIDKSLNLHEALKDYKGKLSLGAKIKPEEKALLEEKVQSLEQDILTLTGQNYE